MHHNLVWTMFLILLRHVTCLNWVQNISVSNLTSMQQTCTAQYPSFLRFFSNKSVTLYKQQQLRQGKKQIGHDRKQTFIRLPRNMPGIRTSIFLHSEMRQETKNFKKRSKHLGEHNTVKSYGRLLSTDKGGIKNAKVMSAYKVG